MGNEHGLKEGFSFFEHTADLGFEVVAKNLDNAYSISGKAMFSAMVDLEEVGSDIEESFEIESENLKSLLYDFLDHLIFLRDYKNAVFKEFDVKVGQKKGKESLTLKCSVKGSSLEGIEGSEVKAITYNDMVFEEKDGGYFVRAVMDM